MKKIFAVAMALGASGCAAIFSSTTSKIDGPQGTTVDGMQVPIVVSNKFGHEVKFTDGTSCFIRSEISGGYLALDIFTLTLIALVVDGATSDWNRLDGVGCPVSID